MGMCSEYTWCASACLVHMRVHRGAQAFACTCLRACMGAHAVCASKTRACMACMFSVHRGGSVQSRIVWKLGFAWNAAHRLQRIVCSASFAAHCMCYCLQYYACHRLDLVLQLPLHSHLSAVRIGAKDQQFAHTSKDQTQHSHTRTYHQQRSRRK